jgi:hypothetical protein
VPTFSLADPPETPIDIDGAIEYDYVIAQRGAIAIEVDDDADFEFALTPGEPAILKLTFTGTILATDQYKTVTIRLTLSNGQEQEHTPQFRILGTSASQRIPNITAITSRRVSPNQSIAVKTTTDIPVTSYNVANLPGGLSINTSSGLITGAAPSTADFYLITLQAFNGDYHYYRYFILVVGTGSTVSGVPPFFFPNLPS